MTLREKTINTTESLLAEVVGQGFWCLCGPFLGVHESMIESKHCRIQEPEEGKPINGSKTQQVHPAVVITDSAPLT